MKGVAHIRSLTGRLCSTRREAIDETNIRQRLRSASIMMGVCGLFILALPAAAFAAPAKATDVHPYIQLALYLGGLSLLPFAVMTLTSFLRIVIVLSFLRTGLGTQNVPPNIVVIALALFLSLFVMGPTLDQINAQALTPFQANKITFNEALTKAQQPLESFMGKQLGHNSKSEIRFFYQLAEKQCKEEKSSCASLPTTQEVESKGAVALPMRVIIPVFIISELKKAFIMGFAVLLPFLVIDMVISNILLSLGMFMLPPTTISLPFKILLFVLSGGWTMIVKFLVQGFNY